MYKISVIIPIYNSEKQLPACLESMAGQTAFSSIQLVLVDDGSTDFSGKICDEFALSHENTQVIHKANSGVSSARNAGLEIAEGEYIGFVDADDTVAPNYFEKLLSAMENSGADMTFGSHTLIWNGEKRENKAWYAGAAVLSARDITDYAERMLTDGSQNSVWTKLMRREIIEKNGIRFSEQLKIGEDKLFVLEYLRHCKIIASAETNGYFYFYLPTSAMNSQDKMAQLVYAFEDEVRLFVNLGIEEKTVREKKSAYLFYELADFLQRKMSLNAAEAKKEIESSFSDEGLMNIIDFGLKKVKKSSGRIYSALAFAFKKRSVALTLAVLFVQKKINKNL